MPAPSLGENIMVKKEEIDVERFEKPDGNIEVEYKNKIKKLDEMLAEANEMMRAGSENKRVLVEQVVKTKQVPIFKKEKKMVKYCKIKFRNIFEPKLGASFTYNGEPVRIKDGQEIELKKEIVDHLESIVIRDSRFLKSDGSKGSLEKVYEETPRYSCVIIGEFEKEEEVKVRVA